MKKGSFLLVSDNGVALRELTDILRYCGFGEMRECNSASDAWAVLSVQAFDCVLSSWEMPDMSGLALLRIVRQDDRYFNVPFFLIDAAFTKLKVIQAGKAGVTGLIVQPFDVNNLRGKLESLQTLVDAAAPLEAESTLNKGLELIESGNLDDALTVFQQLIEEEESAEVYYNIGYIKTAQAQYGEAIEAFRKATQLDRLYAKAFKAMGRVYQTLGKAQDAEKYLQKAADIYMSKEKDEDAEQILTEIQEINPETINVYNSLGVICRRRGDFIGALKHYSRALKIHPNEPHIYYNIGKLYIYMKEPQKAKTYFEGAVRIKPTFQDAKDIIKSIELGTLGNK